ncbi:methyltransferase domain-containing protein [Ichthyobacterium seriolicida]|uniref:Methyltransferase n=1 Tax=Ichthyobacterium seriolicida TaxID=242600 RepID=A0A1J1E1Z3_9FLAO|nr:methyltransferase domain-containing protein [Ichthyobacterium seriolicida]BAV94973.1 methyltransferase [Ichthyobacterium seriolicida]
MTDTISESSQGHWVLAKMGKRVLRPGGKELTRWLIENIDINPKSSVVEFAPGLGLTALLALEYKPSMYTGIEMIEDVANSLEKKIGSSNVKIVIANANKTSLSDEVATQVYGEAMLTMQSDNQKSDIIKEAYRILKKGGLYGIHELELVPNEIPDDHKKKIRLALSKEIKVNARPLTENEWVNILVKEGFKIKKIYRQPMRLLEIRRVIADEGVFNTLKILINVLSHPLERKRILAMRKLFFKYKPHMSSISIIAEK